MSAFFCETCGAPLRLSLPDRAYLCETSPREHRFDRGEMEQAWLKEGAKVVEDAPGDVDAVFQLASLCGKLASTSLRAGDPDPARVYMGQVVHVVELLYDSQKDDERARAMLMEALVEQATVSEKLKDHGVAASAYERLLLFVQAQADADPKNLELQRNLSTCLNSAGRMLRALGNGVGAKKYFERDLALIDHLLELYPEQTDLLFDRAVAGFNLFLVSDTRPEEASHLEQVIETIEHASPGSLPNKASELLQRAKAELERIRGTDEKVPSRLAKATAEAMQSKQGKQQDEPVAEDQRGWLIEQVEAALRAKRKKLAVLR